MQARRREFDQDLAGCPTCALLERQRRADARDWFGEGCQVLRRNKSSTLRIVSTRIGDLTPRLRLEKNSSHVYPAFTVTDDHCVFDFT